jgi:hypothetical protein
MLCSGVDLILWSVVVDIVATIADVLKLKGVYLALLPLGISMVAFVLNLAGAWMLTIPDPGGIGEDRYGTSRKLIRITLMICVMQPMMNIVATTTRMPPVVPMPYLMLTVVVSLAGVIAIFATLQ